MENKDNKEFEKETLASGFVNYKDSEADFSWLIGLVLVAGIFGDWGSKSKTEELEKRIAKLEAKNEIIEKILF